MSSCILISTCDRYEPVARLTGALIQEWWQHHPPVYYCGLSRGSGLNALPLKHDTSDWMSILQAACDHLLKGGFTDCYLILDDHPPVGRCHHQHLNVTLPRLRRELDAVYIGLLGWGQRHNPHGKILGAEHHHLEHSSPSYRWHFSLHPGLWDLSALKKIVDRMVERFDPPMRTPWKFERYTDVAGDLLPDEFLGRSYRIFGLGMSATRLAASKYLVREIRLLGIDMYRFFTRIAFGQAARDRLDSTILSDYQFYDGPYPIFWSGVMKQGKLNQNLVRWLRQSHRTELLQMIFERVNSMNTGIPPAHENVAA